MVITCNGDHKRAKPVATGKHRGQGSTRRSGVRARSMGVRVSALGSREGSLAHPDTIPDDVTAGILAGRFSVQAFLRDTVSYADVVLMGKSVLRHRRRSLSPVTLPAV